MSLYRDGLPSMLNKDPQCEGCALETKGQGWANPEGSGASGLMVMAEALGVHEASDGWPLRPNAPAGMMFNKILKLAQIPRGDLVIANTINCRPPNNWLSGAPWEHAAISHCAFHREQVMRDYTPKAILALGEVATRTLTGLSGNKLGIGYLRGFVLDSLVGIPVIPSYHPSFILQGNQKFIGVCILDYLKALDVAKRGYYKQDVHYNTVPSERDMREFYEKAKAQPEALIAFDIETDYTQENDEFEYHDQENSVEQAQQKILTVQFSFAPRTGLSVPLLQATIGWVRSVLQLPNPKAGHNAWRFDLPRLLEANLPVLGTVHDTMWMFHHLQPDLTGHYNLQSVASFYGMDFPWKHKSNVDLQWYGCADVDAVQRIMLRLPHDMKQKGVWDSYMRHIVQLEPILCSMSNRGIPINDSARVALKGTLEGQKIIHEKTLNSAFPEELKNCKPKEGYKREPKDTTGMIQREFCVDDEKVLAESSLGLVTRWCRIEPFKASKDQISRYITFKGHPMQRHPKEDRDTTNAQALERLYKKTKDPFYRSILDFRAVEKLISTYVDGWAPAKDGRVHPQFLYKPATGQLSSIRPNAQNTPAGKGKDPLKSQLARDFRKIIEAPPGYQLIEFDWHSFHGMTLGLEAQDPDWMRLARLDMHSFLTSFFIKEPAQFTWPDAQLTDYLQYIKRKYPVVRDTQAKPAILGVQFGLGANSLYKLNMDCFANVREAQRLIDMIFDLFPKVKSYQEKIMHLAHRQHILVSRFGYPRWFWDVMSYSKTKECWIRSEQAEQAIAFFPANDAFGHKKEVMLKLREEKWDELFDLVNEIHDSLFFCCPKNRVPDCLERVKGLMEAPSEVLVDSTVAPNGLKVEVEVKVGDNWSEMKNGD